MSLHNGFYESVINKLINEEILKIYNQNNKYIDKKPIDKEEANAVLSKYMSIVMDKSLRNISGDDKHYRQVEICNKIVELLKEELKLEDLDEYIINENAELLLAILELKQNSRSARQCVKIRAYNIVGGIPTEKGLANHS